MKKNLLVVLFVSSLLIITGCSSNDVAKPTVTSTPVVMEKPTVEAATPSPAPKTIGDQFTIGDIVTFGSYEQDGNKDNGAEPLEWLVLKQENNRFFLLSNYAIEVMDFAPNGGEGRWVTSLLRNWLNGEFYQAAFTDAERECISKTTHQNYYRIDQPTGRFAEGREYYSNGTELYEDEDTEDYVFLLSADEAGELSSDQIICKPTQYALDNGAKVFASGNCSWWLRSIGAGQYLVNFVMQKGDIAQYMTSEEGRCVRPAIWITAGD